MIYKHSLLYIFNKFYFLEQFQFYRNTNQELELSHRPFVSPPNIQTHCFPFVLHIVTVCYICYKWWNNIDTLWLTKINSLHCDKMWQKYTFVRTRFYWFWQMYTDIPSHHSLPPRPQSFVFFGLESEYVIFSDWLFFTKFLW